MVDSTRDTLDSSDFLERVNLDNGTLEFARVDLAQFRSANFLDERLERQAGARKSLSIQDAMRIVSKARADHGGRRRINHIFHTAFCCSTLISRCLDIPGRSRSLREPSVVLQLANYKRGNHPLARDRGKFTSLIDTVIACLTLTGDGGEYVALKATNAANNIAVEMSACESTGNILLLYSGLQRFLVSVIGKGEGCRAYVRRLFNLTRGDSPQVSGLPLETCMQMTDLQLAAFVWHMQLDQYLGLLETPARRAIRTLDCDAFLEAPALTLTRLATHFGYDIAPQIFEDIVSGSAFKRYSKNPDRAYNNAVRDELSQDILREHGEEVQRIIEWSAQIRAEGPLHLPLPQPL